MKVVIRVERVVGCSAHETWKKLSTNAWTLASTTTRKWISLKLPEKTEVSFTKGKTFSSIFFSSLVCVKIFLAPTRRSTSFLLSMEVYILRTFWVFFPQEKRTFYRSATPPTLFHPSLSWVEWVLTLFFLMEHGSSIVERFFGYVSFWLTQTTHIYMTSPWAEGFRVSSSLWHITTVICKSIMIDCIATWVSRLHQWRHRQLCIVCATR